MKKQILKSNGTDTVYAPAFPLTGPQIFQSLRVALTNSLGIQPGFPRLARMIGENTSLTHYWFRVLPHRHVIGFLSLLERLPELQRNAWLDEHCRELPRIDHPRLAHDLIAVSNLEQTLRAQRGITWIQGGTDYYRTFVITALAHSAVKFHGERALISGVDVHEPRKWVPVETVTYIMDLLSAPTIKRAIGKLWPDIQASKSAFVLLNGVWETVPELHESILSLALNRHLLVTVARACPRAA